MPALPNLPTKHNLILPLAFIFILLGYASTSLAETVNHQSLGEFSDPAPKAVSTGWSFHWSDLKFDDQWLFEQARWQATADPFEISGRADENILWLKLELPKGQWRDPTLFINSVDLTLQIFEQGQMSYQFGNIDQAGNSSFAGWPWHLIPIKNILEPTTLYFRIYSNYPFIGLSGEVTIGNRSDLLKQVYSRGITGLIFILIIFIVGILCTCLGLIKKERRIAFSTGLLSFDLALMMFAENELSQIAYFAPLLWRYIAAFGYFLVPLFLAFVVKEWFYPKVTRMTGAVAWISAVFALCVAAISSLTTYSFVLAYPYFDILFIFLVLALLIDCISSLEKASIQDSIVTFGIFMLFTSLMLDMLSAHGYITWIAHAGQWGLVLFTLSMLAVYLVKDIKQQTTLDDLLVGLEKQVADRTRELTDSQTKLAQLAHEDGLTGLLNRRAFLETAQKEIVNAIRYQRPISLVMFDIDHFKEINDTYGHATGDEVLKALAKVVQLEAREGDLICRYGGEEFIALLSSTSPVDARGFVERLHSAIQQTSTAAPDGTLVHITASFGLVASEHSSRQANTGISSKTLLTDLIKQADIAMYDIKKSGRNGIKECLFK